MADALSPSPSLLPWLWLIGGALAVLVGATLVGFYREDG